MGDPNGQSNSEILDLDFSLPESQAPLRTQTDFTVFTVTHFVATTGAATAANFTCFFVAPMPCVLMKVYERHEVAASDTGARLRVDKLIPGTTAGDGVAMADVLDVSTDADTPVAYEPTATLENARLAAGDSVEVRNTAGSLSGLVDCTITCLFRVNLKDLPK